MSVLDISSPEKREQLIGLRVSKAQYEIIKEIAQKQNVPPSLLCYITIKEQLIDPALKSYKEVDNDGGGEADTPAP